MASPVERRARSVLVGVLAAVAVLTPAANGARGTPSIDILFSGKGSATLKTTGPTQVKEASVKNLVWHLRWHNDPAQPQLGWSRSEPPFIADGFFSLIENKGYGKSCNGFVTANKTPGGEEAFNVLGNGVDLPVPLLIGYAVETCQSKGTGKYPGPGGTYDFAVDDLQGNDATDNAYIEHHLNYTLIPFNVNDSKPGSHRYSRDGDWDRTYKLGDVTSHYDIHWTGDITVTVH